jgi:hypothetical protein
MLELKPGNNRFIIPIKIPESGTYKLTFECDNSKIIRDKNAGNLLVSKTHQNPYYGPNLILRETIEVEVQHAPTEKK